MGLNRHPGWPRFVSAVVAVASLTAAMLCALSTAPSLAASQADGIHWVLHPRSVVMHRAGQAYRIRMWVTDGSWRAGPDGREREQSIKIVVSSRRYAGPDLHAIQKHFFAFVIDRSKQPGFTHPADMTTAAVQTSDHSYGTLRLRLHFDATGHRVGSCHGHTTSRTGLLSGSLLFRPPHSDIGDITKFNERSQLVHSDGTCEVGQTPQPVITSSAPCPSTTSVATGRSSPSTDTMSFIARRDPDSDTATVNVWSHEYGPPYVWHTIEAVVPADHVQIASDLSSVLIRGGAGTFLAGKATASQSGPPTPWTASAGCPPDDAAEGSMQAPQGNYDGDLRADLFLAADRSVAKIPVEATAYVDISQG